jgi:DNA-binding MarR family transcriptional regulator
MAEATRAEQPGTLNQAALAGQRMLPLIEHLSRVGRRSAETCMDVDCLRPRHLIALKVLGEHGPMTQHAVGVALSLDPSNVVGLLNELEERDLIVRRRDPADRRRHIVELSAAGSEQVVQSNAQLGTVEDNLFKVLSPEERSTLYGLLARTVIAPGDPQSPCAAPASECAAAPASECVAAPAECTEAAADH